MTRRYLCTAVNTYFIISLLVLRAEFCSRLYLLLVFAYSFLFGHGFLQTKPAAIMIAALPPYAFHLTSMSKWSSYITFAIVVSGTV